MSSTASEKYVVSSARYHRSDYVMWPGPGDTQLHAIFVHGTIIVINEKRAALLIKSCFRGRMSFDQVFLHSSSVRSFLAKLLPRYNYFLGSFLA